MLPTLDVGWMTIGWTVVAAIFLTLAGVYLVLAARLRGEGSLAYLLFVIVAIGAAGMAISELALANAWTTDQYAATLKSLHLPYGLITLALPWFVYVLFGTGRRWLAVASNVLYLIVLAMNQFSADSRLFGEITAIERHVLLGDEFAHAFGTPHPGRWIGQLATLVLLVFVADAAAQLWRQGGRRRAIVVGGAVFASAAFGVGHSALVSAGMIHSPYMVSVGFLVLLAGMAYELVDEALRAATLGGRVRRQAEELQVQEERLRMAAEAGDLGLWSWTDGAPAIWLTPRARRLLGLDTRSTATWVALLEIVHAEDREQVIEQAKLLRERGGEFSGEFRVLGPEGETWWIAADGIVDLPETGAVLRARGVVRNVTERRETQAVLELQRAEVAHLSRITMMSEMSSSLAHELNQPLTAILSNAQAALRFMKRDPPDLEEVRAALEAVVAEDRYASDVIERLRTFLRKGERRTEPIDLNALVEEVIRLADVELRENHVRVEKDLASNIPAVTGDRVLLEQVLLNLVRNGTDAMAEIGVEQRSLTIRTRVRDGGIEIVVGDRGTGVPPEEAERIFEPFYTTRSEGLGLGLAVSRTIVRMHGGEIQLASPSPAPGADFSVFLPTHAATELN